MTDNTPNGHNGEVDPKVKWAFIAVVAVAFLVSLIQGYAIKENRERANEALEANSALCSFRNDLQRRADNARQFIQEIESGERPPIQGISTNDLRRSLDGQESTLQSLMGLDCPKD